MGPGLRQALIENRYSIETGLVVKVCSGPSGNAKDVTARRQLIWLIVVAVGWTKKSHPASTIRWQIDAFCVNTCARVDWSRTGE